MSQTTCSFPECSVTLTAGEKPGGNIGSTLCITELSYTQWRPILLHTMEAHTTTHNWWDTSYNGNTICDHCNVLGTLKVWLYRLTSGESLLALAAVYSRLGELQSFLRTPIHTRCWHMSFELLLQCNLFSWACVR